jgi:hypothetical protein
MTLNAGSPPEHLQLTTISWVIGTVIEEGEVEIGLLNMLMP